MKKVYSWLIAAFMLLTTLPVSAAEATLLTIEDITVNYANNTININCKTEVGYLQSVTAVIYDTNDQSPDWDSYVRADEKVTNAEGKVTVILPLGEDMTKSSYTVKVTGSGVMALRSKHTKEFTIIPLTASETRVDSYNKADSATLSEMLNKDKEALGINLSEVYQNNQTEYLEIVKEIRSTDYANGFENLTDITKAYNNAGVLLEMGKATNASDYKTLLEDNAGALGLDTTDEDYIKLADDVSTLLLEQNKADKASSLTELSNRFEGAIIIAAVNDAKVGEMKDVIVKYAQDLGISDLMEDYQKLNAADTASVARQLIDTSYKSVAEIKEAFNNALLLVLENPSEDDDEESGSGGGGGGGGGGGFGGGASGTYSSNYEKPQTPAADGAFTDIGEFAWAKDSINALSIKGIINGYEDGTFKGNNSVTRSEFVKIVVAAFGLYDGTAICDFTDTDPNAWYAPFVGSAVAHGIVGGYPDGSFGPSIKVSREEAAVILARAAKAAKITITPKSAPITFTDEETIAEYAKADVNVLTQATVINGFEDGSFGPKLPLSRAQAAKLIYELIKLM